MIPTLGSVVLRGTFLGALLVVSAQSHADVLNLNYMATSADGVSTTNAVLNSVINTPVAQSQNTYSHTFNSPLGFAVPGSVSGSNPAGFEFYDDYVFTIGLSSLSSITATIDLDQMFDISNLNVRLFSWDGTAEQLSQTVTVGTTSPNTIQAWTYATGSGDVAVINQTGLGAGTYVLQVRGNVDGAAGGTYVGTLNVAPVPLPAALPLLLSGFGLLGGLFNGVRRRLLDAVPSSR